MLQTEARPAPLKDRFELETQSEIEATVLQSIREAIKGLRFGEVNISVQDGHVVQIERISRVRRFKSKRML